MANNEYLQVGVINRPVGLKGEVKVFNTSSFKNIRYKKGNKLYLFLDDSYKELTIKSYREKDDKFVILSFDEFEEINDIMSILNKQLFVKKDPSILRKNEFFYDDLLKLNVFSLSGDFLGKVVKIEEFPSQITLKIEKNITGSYFFVPFNDAFIKEIDLKNNLIKIELIEGLL